MMTDDVKPFDNSQVAVWKREITELTENLKYPERYSNAEFKFMQSRKAELEEAIRKNNEKKKNNFKNSKQIVDNKSTQVDAMYSQVGAYRG